MRFIIKNITGDPTNANSDLHEGKKLYACSDNLSNLSIIGPQETQSISAKAYEELLATFPTYFSVIDSDGSTDKWAPFRTNVTIPSGVWTLWDAGRTSGKWDLTNTTGNTIQWSFSGFTSPATSPAANSISDLHGNETIQFWTPMNPLRYIYLYSSAGGGASIDILVS